MRRELPKLQGSHPGHRAIGQRLFEPSADASAFETVKAHRDFGEVNILVNNAGTAIRKQDRQILSEGAD